MELHVILVVLLAVLSVTYAEKKEGKPSLIHHLTKRQAADNLGPLPYSARDERGSPLPYQHSLQGDADGNSVAGSAAGSGDSRSGRDPYQHDSSLSSGHNSSIEDWVPSAGYGYDSSSQAGSEAGSDGAVSGEGRPYYQYQAPISSGHRVPTQTHVADMTRYTFTRPLPSGSPTPGRTYRYPFGGSQVAGVYGRGSNRVSAGASAARGRGEGSGGAGSGEGGAVQSASVNGDEEPVIQVFPSERPVINPQPSRQQQIRQRELERQRRLELLRQRQTEQQQREAAQQARLSGQQRHQRPIYTGGRPVGSSGNGQGSYYPRGRQQPQYGRPQPQHGAGQGGQGIYGSQGQPVYGGQGQPVYGSRGQSVYGGQVQPIYGGQGQPVYGGSQQPFYTYGYQGGVDSSEYNSECPNTGMRIQINGIPCEQAVDRYGSYLCYRHEYTSRECCLKCLSLKNPARIGCEYGDHSGRCQELQPYDCYDLRNRQTCCQACDRMRKRGPPHSGSLQQNGIRTSCEYGDMTPNCDRVRQNPGLCYIPENRYLCCETCHNIRASDNAECPWGDQNPDLCQPFDATGNIRINCYAPPIKRICCQACQRLEDWIPFNQPGCEYGDRPVTFNTGSHRNINCTSFMRYYGYEQCSLNQAVSTNCCYTCHRYSQG